MIVWKTDHCIPCITGQSVVSPVFIDGFYKDIKYYPILAWIIRGACDDPIPVTVDMDWTRFDYWVIYTDGDPVVKCKDGKYMLIGQLIVHWNNLLQDKIERK